MKKTDVWAEFANKLMEPIGISEYQVLVDEGKKERENMDASQIRIGKLIAQLPIVEGAHTIREYAKDIGVGRSSAYEYLAVVNFYEGVRLADYLNPDSPITYTHLRQAMWKNSDQAGALAMLDNWTDNLTTPDEAVFEGNVQGKSEPDWEKLREMVVAFGSHFKDQIEEALKELQIRPNQSVRMVFYKPKE